MSSVLTSPAERITETLRLNDPRAYELAHAEADVIERRNREDDAGDRLATEERDDRFSQE